MLPIGCSPSSRGLCWWLLCPIPYTTFLFPSLITLGPTCPIVSLFPWVYMKEYDCQRRGQAVVLVCLSGAWSGGGHVSKGSVTEIIPDSTKAFYICFKRGKNMPWLVWLSGLSAKL